MKSPIDVLRSRRLAAAFVALAVAACGDSSGPASLPDAVVGSWVAAPGCASCGFTVTSISNPADSLNIVSFLGMTVAMDIGRSGSFTLSYGSSTNRGTARAAGTGVLVVKDEAGIADTLDYTRRGDLLDIRLRKHWTLDVTGDGRPETVQAKGTFQKR